MALLPNPTRVVSAIGIIILIISCRAVRTPGEDSTIEIGGTFVGIGFDGNEVRGGEGKLIFAESEDNEHPILQIAPLQNGHWSARVRRESHIHFRQVRAAGRFFTFEVAPIYCNHAKNIQLMARESAPRDPNIQVIDDESGAQLSNLEIVKVTYDGYYNSWIAVNAKNRLSIERFNKSPLPSDGPWEFNRSLEELYLVKSLGYRWTPISSDAHDVLYGSALQSDGPSIFKLTKESTARVRVENIIPKDASLIVYEIPEPTNPDRIREWAGKSFPRIIKDYFSWLNHVATIPLEGRRELDLESLPRRPLLFILQYSPPGEGAAILDAREVNFTKSHSQTVSLASTDIDSERNATLRGTIQLDDSREPSDIVIQAHHDNQHDHHFVNFPIVISKEGLRSVPGKPKQYSFGANRLRPGIYSIRFGEERIEKPVILTAGAVETVDILFPKEKPASETAIRFVDADTRAPSIVTRPQWREYREDEGISEFVIFKPLLRDSNGNFSLTTNVDLIEIRYYYDNETQWQRYRFTRDPAIRDLTIRVARSLRGEIALREEGRLIAAPDDYFIIKFGQVHGRDETQGHGVYPYHHYSLISPGEYRLSIKTPPGYEPVPDQIIQIPTASGSPFVYVPVRRIVK